jgi:hypothetical protein
MKVTAAMACVRVRSQDFAKLPPMIERVAKDGTHAGARSFPLRALPPAERLADVVRVRRADADGVPAARQRLCGGAPERPRQADGDDPGQPRPREPLRGAGRAACSTRSPASASTRRRCCATFRCSSRRTTSSTSAGRRSTALVGLSPISYAREALGLAIVAGAPRGEPRRQRRAAVGHPDDR